jgi:hypothetical protein
MSNIEDGRDNRQRSPVLVLLRMLVFNFGYVRKGFLSVTFGS